MRRKKSGERDTSTSSAQGFTLVELAIVLVIIGIIIGAVMKGQDLIDNARAKKVTTTTNTWNMLTWAYMDRKGRFPGDGNRDGIIGNQAAPINEQLAAGSAIGEIAALTIFTNPPDNPIAIGSYQFYVYIGYDTSISKNVLVICKTVNCAATVFTSDELKLIEAVDTAIDGLSDAGLGQFRGATAVTLLPAVPTLINSRYAAAVTAVTGVDETTAGLTTAWAITQNAAVWLFDRPY